MNEKSEKNTGSGENQPKENKKRSYVAGQFEGPLDLLLYLVKESEINIYDIPIAEITEQYLDYLDYPGYLALAYLALWLRHNYT